MIRSCEEKTIQNAKSKIIDFLSLNFELILLNLSAAGEIFLIKLGGISYDNEIDG